MVVPRAIGLLGLNSMTVSVMFTGAGSMALSARPILPTTLSTSGICGNDLVLPAKNLGRLGEGNAGIGNGHEQGSLFIERRHELGADRGRQPERRGKDYDGRTPAS